MSHSTTTTHDLFIVPAERWGATRNVFAALGGLGLVGGIVGFVTDRGQFFHSYLTAFVFVLTVCLGLLFFVMVQHVARAGWSVALRRLAEVGAACVPVLALLFLPILAGMGDLFEWAHRDAVSHDPLLQHKEAYLNPAFFIIRAAIYFLVWILLARYFLRRSLSQDADRDPMTTVRLQRRAAPGIVLFAFTLTFMGFDWLMSLSPHWYSTIFGVYVFSGSALSSFAFLALASISLRRAGHLRHTFRTDHFQDLGRWMFAFSIFWTYIAFSQYFLIWYGNLPEETIYYVNRSVGTWGKGGLFLAVGHFAVPFVLLMSRWTKRRPGFVAGMAVWILLIHYWDIYFMVMPKAHPEGIRFHWLDAACLVGVAGVFLAVFAHRLRGRALVPVGDPRLPESLALEHLY